MNMAYCSEQNKFFCKECAKEFKLVKSNFFGWKYFSEYRSPWSDKLEPTLEYLEYINKHPYIKEGNLLSCDSISSVKDYIDNSIKPSQIALQKKINNEDNVADLWGSNADIWDSQILNKGDIYRKYITDPYLLNLLGQVDGLNIIDIGCGNGYLCRKLYNRNAQITGVEISKDMLRVAEKHSSDMKIKYILSSATNLQVIKDNLFDIVIFNHVLSSVDDCYKALEEAKRISKNNGKIFIMTSHPCFSSGDRCWYHNISDSPRAEEASHYSADNYFDNRNYLINSWEGFSPIPYFHKTLSDYWEIFNSIGLQVDNFIEPKLELLDSDLEVLTNLYNLSRIPLSCFFILSKKNM